MGQLWTRRNLAIAVVAISALQGCSSALKEDSNVSIGSIISGVTDGSGNVQAVFVEGDAPGDNGGPTATVSANAIMINGGSSQQGVTGSASFNKVIVSVAGLTDYYELTLPAGVGSENIVVTANPDTYKGIFSFNYAVANGASVGAYATQAVRMLRVGTGDIQISVAWTDSADVDLHVTDPNGETIYFGHKNAQSGGTLDLDANAACTKTSVDGQPAAYISNENVVWPVGRAIPGTYTVVLDYWSDCGVAKTDWVVTIGRVGAPPQLFTGSFIGVASGVPDDTVAVFTH